MRVSRADMPFYAVQSTLFQPYDTVLPFAVPCVLNAQARSTVCFDVRDVRPCQTRRKPRFRAVLRVAHRLTVPTNARIAALMCSGNVGHAVAIVATSGGKIGETKVFCCVHCAPVVLPSSPATGFGDVTSARVSTVPEAATPVTTPPSVESSPACGTFCPFL
jgi:hypothetical protein